MISIRKRSERGHFNHGWLDTYHTFSFGRYVDRQHMGFRSLRVMNEDVVQPGQGFGTHGHENMEIITHVLEGELEHKDSLGNGSVLRPGELQRMTAGTGILHSEFNPSSSAPVHLYQIWLLPEREGLEPSYEQRAIAPEETQGQLRLIASRDGRDGALTVNQDVELFLANLAGGDEISHKFRAGRHGWLQVSRGAVALNGHQLIAGDGAAISDEKVLDLKANESAQVLLFDLT